jgi:antitoxin FitA
MAVITIRNLEDSVKRKLRIRAASHNHSMEEEARLILRETLKDRDEQGGLGTLIHKRFMEAGGIELAEPVRAQAPRKADFRE